MKLKNTLIVLFAFLTVSNAQAFSIEEISTDPAAAISGDDVTILIQGVFPHTGCRIENIEYEIDGDTLVADLIGFDSGGGGQMGNAIHRELSLG